MSWIVYLRQKTKLFFNNAEKNKKLKYVNSKQRNVKLKKQYQY